VQDTRSDIAGVVAIVAALAFASPAFAQADGEVVTKQYEDGGVYEGTFAEGKQHGTGTYRLPNGYEYSGEWVDGEIRGQGVARCPNDRARPLFALPDSLLRPPLLGDGAHHFGEPSRVS